MNYNSFFKKQTFLITSSICLMLIIFVGMSYAYFTQIVEGEETMVVSSGDLQIKYNSGTKITGILFPISNEDGLATTGYSFSLENKGSYNARYTVELLDDSSVSGTHLNHDYIKVSFNGGTPVTLSSLEKVETGASQSDNVYKLYSNTINKTATINDNVVRVWVSDDTPDDALNTTVALKLKIVSEALSD